MNAKALNVAITLFVLLLPARGFAQVGSTTDILMGRIASPDSQAVTGARVEATSVETGITRTKTTGADGRYTIVFPDGGGTYRLTVRAVGMAPVTRTITRQGDEDRIITDFDMGRIATQLATVQVRAAPRRGDPSQRPEPGSTERNLNPNLINRLPVDAGDLTALAALAPGVISVPGTDTTKASFSVAGQPANQNNITLDGLSFGAGSVPQEAVRSTRVVTSTYDVARGQFTGGQVASTTRGGTNNVQGAFSYSVRDPSLEFVDDTNPAFGQKYTQNQLSGGAGGPIIKDKLFTFGAISFSHRTDPLLSLLAADPLTLQRLGTNPDSVSRFLNIVQTFGLPLTSPLAPDERLNNNTSALVRVDYSLAEDHSLMLRGDWRGNTQLGSRLNALALPHSGGNLKGSGRGGMMTLTSHVGMFINELRGYKSVDNRNTEGYLSVPDGRVVVSSILGDGTNAISTLQFGGNPSLPQETKSSLLEVSDEISRLTTAGGHRFKLGGLLNQQRSSVGFIPNRFGTFTFNSLADFEAGQPTQFTRTLFARDQQSATNNAAVYLGDSWRVTPQFQMTYGLRMEGSRYPDKPDYNPDVEATFGRRTDNLPSEVRVSPRAGFSVFVGESQFGPPPLTLRGGIGEFRGTAPAQLFASALNSTGLNNGQSLLTCVGAAAPTPDWAAYLADPSTIPASCNGGTPTFANERRNVTVFDPGFQAPRAWRASFGLSRRFWDRYSFSLDAGYARGVAQTGQTDINLDTTAKFTLSNENNRPVYAPANAIIPTTGAVSVLGSRLYPQFGVVSQIESNLRSDTKQLTLGLNGITTKGILINASYTLTSSFDQSQGFSQGSAQGFGGTPGSTSGNPNLSEWGRSDNARHHALLGTITYPIKPVLELTMIARATSGAYYSPLVGGDINGDGRGNNDRAFVFNPADAALRGDTAVANGMTRLLAGTSSRARDCLLSQTGKVASRSSCSSPWSPSLDLQANIRPASFGLDRRLTISVIALNTLTGLDQLLHGSNNLYGWGQPSFPDRTLLYVRGFDPTTDTYKYQVNEHFGVTNGTRNAFRVPFQIAIQGRLALGTDPARQQFNNAIGRGPGGSRMNPEALKARMTRLVPNAFLDIIAINDSAKIELTPDQIAKLQSSGDAFKVKADSLVDKVANMLADTTVKNPDPMTVFAKLQPSMVEGRKLATQAINEAKAVLTPAQWAKVPESIKTPGLRRGGGEGGGGFDRGGGPG
ncbi:MAG TPA: carboxypeptidase regulatory-like domain-containing protein [Gemmatimonadaceae bacterium]|nr:carboxypeptidase regulatory-like domain-containing protein [Gemmatimonadaceae bacterium]